MVYIENVAKKHYVVEGRIPSKKNNKSALVIRGRAMIITTGKFLKWNKQAIKDIQKQGVGETIEKAKSLTFCFFAPDARKGDLSNKFESVADLLVDSKVLSDDNWTVIPNVNLYYCGIDRERPRAEITIEY